MSSLAQRLSALPPEKRLLLELRRRSSTARAERPPDGRFSLVPHGDRDKLPADAEDAYPLSMMQAAMLYHMELTPGYPLYHNVDSYHLEGRFEPGAFNHAVQGVVARHPVLRTSFDLHTYSEPLQVVHRSSPLPLRVVDLRGLSSAAQEAVIADYMEREKRQVFDFSRPPLLRLCVHIRSDETFQFTLTEFHPILDGWSLQSTFLELLRSYGAWLAGEAPAAAPPLSVSYRDFIRLEREALASPECRSYWERRLSGCSIVDLPRWPASYRQISTGRPIRSLVTTLSGEVLTGLQRLSRTASVPLKSIFLAVHMKVLGLLTGQNDVLTGVINHGRPEGVDGDQVRGLFLNTLPFRLQFADGSWADLVRNAFIAEQEMFPFRRYPMPALQRLWGQRRLFETEFNLTNFHVYRDTMRSGLGVRLLASRELEENSFPLCVTFNLDPEATVLRLLVMNHRSELCDPQVDAIIECYVRALTEVAEHPLREHGLFSALQSAERHRQLIEWNDTAARYPSDLCAHQLFAAQAARTPDAVAVACGELRLTYRELDRRTDHLARRLVAERVGAGEIVALLADRGGDLLIAILAVFKAGGAYLPLDPHHPPQRLARVLERSGARVLLEARRFGPLLSLMEPALASSGRLRRLRLEEELAGYGHEACVPLPVRSTPRDLAYVIYTSGSSGEPKGVMVEHRGMLNHLYAKVADLELTGCDIVAQTASQCFDISVWQFLAALLTGGCTAVFADEVTHAPAALLGDIERRGVSIFETVPSMLVALLDEIERRDDGGPVALRWLLSTGEALAPELCRRWLRVCPDVPLLNAYGPTECSDDVSHLAIRQPPTDGVVSMPIGRPLANTQLYVLGQERQLLPVAAAGELVVGGDGVGRGYLRDARRTAEAFVPDPFAAEPGSRLYRTGDLVRLLPDGEIEFLGRLDHQVKVRGFRIELGEIEAALLRQPEVHEAVVVARAEDPAGSRLVAYFTVTPGATQPRVLELRRRLAETLPDYMLPVALIALDALPLTANGKVDRNALPAADGLQEEVAVAGSPHEELLMEIWRELLGGGPVGRRQSFFDLGGHSLLATRMISRIRQAFNVELPLRSLFDDPTPAGLARRIEAAMRSGQGAEAPQVTVLSRDRALPLSFEQERLWFLDQMEPGSAAYNIPSAVRLSGNFYASVFGRALDELVRRHESLRTTFSAVGGRPVQVFHTPASVPLPCVDLSALPEAAREVEVRLLAHREAAQPFDLATGPLLRVRLLRLAPAEHAILFTLHHIISDGWSTEVFVREVTQLYESFAAGRPSPLAELPVQYADFAGWQRQWLNGETLESEVLYWRRRLHGAPELLDLPYDRPRPERRSGAGATRSFELSGRLVEALERLRRQEGATLFMLLLAGFQALLHRLTGQTDIVVGTDVANRNRMELEGLVGFFVNHLVLRADLKDQPTFRELLRQVRETSLEAFAHQDLPFVKLVSALQPKRSAGHMPLFQVLFVFQNAPAQDLALAGLDVQHLDLDFGIARFDLALFAIAAGEGLTLSWTYSTELFDSTTIDRFSARLEQLLESAAADPDIRVNRLEILNDHERKQQTMDTTERQESQVRGLRGGRRRAVDLSQVEPVVVGPLVESGPMPVLVQPYHAEVDVLDWVEGNRDRLESLLQQHGAILFRGFGLRTVASFERFAQTICPDLFAEYGDLPREEAGEKVYQSTPYPPDKTILFHNESSHLHRWPLKQWFFCVQAASTGGETPIVDCRRIYRLLDPALRERFEQIGLMYVRNFTGGLDVDWQDFFRTSDRSEVERFCDAAGIACEWTGHGLRTRQLSPAVATHPRTGEKTFFNQIQLHHPACLEPETCRAMLAVFAPEDLPRSVSYGDGSPIEDEVVEEILRLYWQEAVSFPWQEGDVLMVDNMLTAHARNPFTGPRKIVVAMGELLHYNQGRVEE